MLEYKMKRILFLSIFALSMTSIASATIIKYINVGGMRGNLLNSSDNGFILDMGAAKFWDDNGKKNNGIIASYAVEINGQNSFAGNFYGYGSNLKLGYKSSYCISSYAILSSLLTSFNDKQNAGFGYGAGIEVDTSWKYLGIGVDYITYNMTREIGSDYNYHITKVYLKYKW